MKRAVLLLLLFVAIVGGCLGQAEKERPSTTSTTSSFSPNTRYDVLEGGHERPIVGAINAFAVNLYLELVKDGGNVFFSPYSVETALAMAYEGASGVTRNDFFLLKASSFRAGIQ
ncbi:serpin family protein [Thermococcus sp.]|uniref:serpin family protein n=1 Tax=Thermococcus sp. TaxID=35749 RepID=UPI002628C0B9|nr:serpin family protein [Thermococcus sp.]